MAGKAGDLLQGAEIAAVPGYVITGITVSIAGNIGSADAAHYGRTVIVTADAPSLQTAYPVVRRVVIPECTTVINAKFPVVLGAYRVVLTTHKIAGRIHAVIDAARTVTGIADIGLGKIPGCTVTAGSRYKIRWRIIYCSVEIVAGFTGKIRPPQIILIVLSVG
jgi:hypothetical protein